MPAAAAPVAGAVAAAGGTAGRKVTALVSRSLSGAPSAPMAEGEEGFLSIEARDAAGRLVLLGWAKAGAGGAASSKGATTLPVPALSSSIDDFLIYTFYRDSQGRVTSIGERKGSGPLEATSSWIRGDDGRLQRIERREKGKLAESLSFSWDGSGGSARLLLLDGEGSPKGGGLLETGEGGIEGRSVFLSLVDADGKDDGGLSLAWDAGGRLTRWAIRKGPKAETGPAGSPAGATASQGADSASDALASAAAGGAIAAGGAATIGGAATSPGILDLLFPIWPRDQASFELFASLVAPAGNGDFRAFSESGPLILPFDRPKEGSIDFLWDGQGRLLEAIQTDASGTRIASLEYRYDQRGLLVDEAYSGTGEDGAKDAAILRVYRLDSRRRWLECSSFERSDRPLQGGLRPLEWIGHKILVLPPQTPAASP
ncbi:MAG TPA: hypothetical protein VMV44_02080 [Rectinemataceae bacterium]|nr:hypothetical protein [Rectinemataceae bacterium]